jgi:hypothetical protein
MAQAAGQVAKKRLTSLVEQAVPRQKALEANLMRSFKRGS